MRLLRVMAFGCILLAGRSISSGATPEEAIRNVLEQQAGAWNRRDLKQFVASYAQNCTLVGSTISETTREQVLAHYQQKYPSPGAMGKLTFSGLTVRPLDANIATVTGHWHLERTADSGGPVGGVFSLVFRQLDGQWQILLDHTS